MLGEMQQLTTIQLEYIDQTAALAAAPAWPHLQHLAGLKFEVCCEAVEWVRIVDAVSSVTRWTKLAIWGGVQSSGIGGDVAQAAAMRRLACFCRSLRSLTRLENLELHFSHLTAISLQQGDLLHLSSLISLTRLSLDLNIHWTVLC